MPDLLKSEKHPDITYVMFGCKCSMCQRFGGPDNQPDLIERADAQSAMRIKLAQLTEYRDGLSDSDDEVGKHARTIADGRLLQLEADMALLSLLSKPATV